MYELPYGRWQRLNEPLGIRAFGISAVAMEPGEDIDIEHDEADCGHQEVYVVVSGRAAFRLGNALRSSAPGSTSRPFTRTVGEPRNRSVSAASGVSTLRSSTSAPTSAASMQTSGIAR